MLLSIFISQEGWATGNPLQVGQRWDDHLHMHKSEPPIEENQFAFFFFYEKNYCIKQEINGLYRKS